MAGQPFPSRRERLENPEGLALIARGFAALRFLGEARITRG